MIEYLIAAIVILVVLWFVYVYNSVIKVENRIENAWAQIDVQLKKRADLIPNLVKTVQGYAKHEKSTFETVTKARTAIMNAKGVEEAAEAQNMLTNALKSLFAVAENYPQLQASKNFMMLQEELSGVEGKIAYARQFYNDEIMRYNNRVETFPSKVVANTMGRKEKPQFEIEEKSREVPEVNF